MHTDVTHQASLDSQKLTSDSNTVLTHNSFNTAVSGQDTKAAGKTPRPRLNRRGVVVLEEYVRLHPDDTHPDTMTQKALLVQVQSAQGNSGLKLGSITYWFNRRRAKGQLLQPPQQPFIRRQRVVTPLTPTSPTTPFTEENLFKLHTLTQATPNPGPEVLDIWASLFHVSRPVLQYAIEVVLPSHFRTDSPQTSPSSCHIKSSPPSPTYAPSPRSRRLPTPPRSSTPELLPKDKWSRERSSPKFSKGEMHSPMIPDVTATRVPPVFHQYNRPNIFVPSASLPAPASAPPAVYEQLHFSPPQTPVAEDRSKTFTTEPTAIISAQESTAFRVSTVKNSVLRGLTEACLAAAQNNIQDQPPLPKTAAESDQRFAPYQTKLEHLSIFLDVMLKPSPQPHE